MRLYFVVQIAGVAEGVSCISSYSTVVTRGSPHRRLWASVGGNKGGRRLLPDGDDGFALGFALFHFGERLVDLFERVDRVDGGFQRMVLVE